ncbi:hypothetical protein [Rhodococcus sp. NPDC060176]|uniref:hypothetical protein n=1 Tax=Rhodococcus sp. NPDC060176 TaxID=3347062 RepID=UPI00364C87A8
MKLDSARLEAIRHFGDSPQKRRAPFVVYQAMETLIDGADVSAGLADFHSSEGGTEWRAVWVTANSVAYVTANSNLQDWDRESSPTGSAPSIQGWVRPISSIEGFGLSAIEDRPSAGAVHEWAAVHQIKFTSGVRIDVPLFGDVASYSWKDVDQFVSYLRGVLN